MYLGAILLDDREKIKLSGTEKRYIGKLGRSHSEPYKVGPLQQDTINQTLLLIALTVHDAIAFCTPFNGSSSVGAFVMNVQIHAIHDQMNSIGMLFSV
jgi:hypothetical protein